MSTVPTRNQISSGGVVYRRQDGITEVVLISVGDAGHWQLPKGLVDRGESPETTALREVQEETGLQAVLLDLIDKIEYWYVSKGKADRVRYHKRVFFYLMRFLAGDVKDHDQEVNEARWVEVDQAIQLLAFDSEKKVLESAREMIRELGDQEGNEGGR